MKLTIIKTILLIVSFLLLHKNFSFEKDGKHITKFNFIEPIEPKPIKIPITDAMILVESAGNDSAYNSKEEAVGCLQIRPIMVREVNRILKKTGEDYRFEMEDRWSREKSLEMFHIWREYHHPNSTDEVIARNWNGGPNGFNKESTLKYDF